MNMSQKLSAGELPANFCSGDPMKLSPKTKIDELLKEHKFIEEFLVKYNPKFSMLRSKVARATVGKMANMKAVASVGGVAVKDLLRDVASEVERVTGLRPDTEADELEEQEEVDAPPGHPVHTYMKANEKIAELANKLAGATRDLGSAAGGASVEALEQARSVIEDLSGVDLHYTRVENQLFPFLEKHGIGGSSKVMRGVHDEIRDALKNATDATAKGDVTELAKVGPRLARDLAEMIYKENKILFPMAMQALTPDDWNEVRKGEDEQQLDGDE